MFIVVMSFFFLILLYLIGKLAAESMLRKMLMFRIEDMPLTFDDEAWIDKKSQQSWLAYFTALSMYRKEKRYKEDQND